MHATLSGNAVFETLDPGFKIVLTTADRHGGIAVEVDMTPDIITEAHWFKSNIDQSYLPDVIASLERLLRNFAPREGRPEP